MSKLAVKSRKKPLKPRGKPFEPGNNANPNGRPKGSRNKEYPFLEDFFSIYEEFGGRDGLRDRIKGNKRLMAKFDSTVIDMAQKQLPDKIEHSGTAGGPMVMIMSRPGK
jgi:hypothetical protein